ncbi:hypothetical protein GCK72_021886 [Caenorhabditis remanei]|uniref:Uncharacterized protein n=1 Tax=Caenorhabditis remanei TaxID=31234 RepID=A0A6A5GJ86_CAERE|nr:hypothetical protein GCK72_021886 [Caenorhabditis remanei]KAF1755317.1 hypothetical protein GCK72_021886 [Caenorhabditis remanei]
MSNRREPQVTRNLQATADLLDALQENPTLLNDEEFMKRLSILREKHEETTNFLAKKLGAPPLPTMISSTSTSKSSKTTTQSRIHMTTSTSCHQIPRHLDLHPRESSKSPKEYFDSENYDMEEEEYHLVERRGRLHHQDSESEYMVPTRHEVRVPVRIAPAPPVNQGRRHQIHVITQSAPSSSSRASSLPRHQRTVTSVPPSRQRSENIRQILAEASIKHNLPTASIAMPSGLLLSSTSTKHVPRHPPEFATSSDVVEESFLEDGQSTTREIPTIRDEMVTTEHRSVKRQLENGTTLGQKHRSKSMHNMAEPQVTIPKPFQLSLRKSIGNTYAKKFMSDLMTEKQRQEEAAKIALENTKFKAKPVPKSTYLPTNTFATEQKYVEAMRKKVAAVARKKFEAQSEMFRSKSEGNLASIKPLGYVPPSTYISPIPVRPNARGRSAVTRTAAMIQEATTPKGIKSHRAQSNLTHNLRHGRCKLDTSAVVLHRRTSPPDFNKIHAKINEEYRRTNSKPSTVPIPFKFAHRSPSAPTRHTNCKETPPEQFKPKTPATKPSEFIRIPSTHGAQLREELNRARIQKMRAEETAKNNFWAEDNRKRIASFLGRRSKTEDNLAMRTRMKIQQQQETEQEYMRQLSEMKQRVLKGPLIMEKQTALAQEHRLKRKYEERMKNSKVRSAQADPSRRGSETSAAGTFVVEKNGSSAVTSSRKSESKASSSRSYKKSTSSEESSGSSRSSESTGASGSRKVSSRRSESSSSSSESSSEDNSDDSER